MLRAHPWGSLALCACYSLEGYLPAYRTDVAAISAPAPVTTQPIQVSLPAAAR